MIIFNDGTVQSICQDDGLYISINNHGDMFLTDREDNLHSVIGPAVVSTLDCDDEYCYHGEIIEARDLSHLRKMEYNYNIIDGVI